MGEAADTETSSNSSGSTEPPDEASITTTNSLENLPPKVIALLFSLLPTSSLLALRCCSKAHLARFHAGLHWDDVSQRLVVELHASRLRLETASTVCGPPPPPPQEGDDEEGLEESVHPLPPRRLVARPLAVGHRGACGHMKGNSMASFHHAVHLGADMIELDVCIDRSGDLVVHHDLYLSDGQLLETLTLPEIKKVAPEVEPLSLVLRELRASNVTLYLDLKTDRVVAPLMRLLHEAISKGGWSPQRLLIASFNQYDMIEVNAHRLAYPATLAEVQTCIIVDGVPISFAKEYAALGVKWCSIGDGCVLPSFLDDAHTRGIGVMVWTVNNLNVMQRYVALGVDAVVTDFPERFVAVRDGEEKKEKEKEEALNKRLAAEAATAAALAAETEWQEEKEASAGAGTNGNSSSSPEEQNGQGQEKGHPHSHNHHHHHSHHHHHHHHHHKRHHKHGNGDSSPLMSAYPAPLHQPRKRLVNALRQAWPLLRALEGRRTTATHQPPTPKANEEKRSKLLLTLTKTAGAGGGGGEGMSFVTTTTPTTTGATAAGSKKEEGNRCGLVHHLKSAAKQAEESATAVLQPRLPKRRPPGVLLLRPGTATSTGTSTATCLSSFSSSLASSATTSIGKSSGSGAPQTPPRPEDEEEGEGGQEQSQGERESESGQDTHTQQDMSSSRSNSSSPGKKKGPPVMLVVVTTEGGGGGGGGKESKSVNGEGEGEGDEEAAVHDWPFLPFERTWAQRTS